MKNLYSKIFIYRQRVEMRKIFVFFLFILFVILSFSNELTMKRGINLGNALEAPVEGLWGAVIEESYLDLIKDAGFDTIRIPIRWSAYTSDSEPYVIEEEFFQRVDEVIGWSLKRGLTTIINVHHYYELFDNPFKEEKRFLSIWEQISKRYKDYPDLLFFEILNEPNSCLTPDLWNILFKKAIKIIRNDCPGRYIIIDTPNWGNYKSIDYLELPDEENLIVSFHFYEPFHFTHQGTEWVDGSDKWMGKKWTGTFFQRYQIDTAFKIIKKWMEEKRDIPVFLGEFGAYSSAPYDDRIVWTEYIRKKAEENNISWAYWEFCAGFGIYDLQNEQWDEGLLNSLIK